MAQTTLKSRLRQIIFGTDTPAGQMFDLVLIYMILISVFVVMLDTISWVKQEWGYWLWVLEWIFTIIFTLEYFVRIYIADNRWRYITSFFGLVDLLSILPTYFSLFYPNASYMLVVRVFRVLRIFRILKLARYLNEANVLLRALHASRRKIMVFFSLVFVLSIVFGSMMFLVEGPQNGFTSIPKGVYWTIVTITTVGYGDITPQTVLGQFIASAAMLVGYSILAVPTGILSAEISAEIRRDRSHVACKTCFLTPHEQDSHYCRRCGASLEDAVVVSVPETKTDEPSFDLVEKIENGTVMEVITTFVEGQDEETLPENEQDKSSRSTPSTKESEGDQSKNPSSKDLNNPD